MVHMWWLWIKNRWPGVSVAAIVVLGVLIVVLIATDGTGPGVHVLGNANAPRASAVGGPAAGTLLPRSGDPNAAIGSTSNPHGDAPAPNSNVLDEQVSAQSGPQTVTAAQAAWSGDQIKQRQDEVLAAVNCARRMQGQPALALDAALSAIAGEAWLKLIHDRSFTLINLPGHYALRSVMALDFGTPAPAAQVNQRGQQRQDSPRCDVGGFDATALPQTTGRMRAGIAVFPPQASWDGASAVVLVQ